MTMDEMNATFFQRDLLNDTWELDIGNVSRGLSNVLPHRRASDWLDVVRFVCEICISFPVAVAGIIGNAVTIIVLFHYKPVMTTTVILRWMALNNSFSLLTPIFLRNLRYVGWSQYEKIFPYIFFWMFPMTFAVRLTDVWLTVLLTFDRYIAVCYPLQASRLCSRTKTNVAIFVIFFSAYLFTTPRFFEYIAFNQGGAATVSYQKSYLLRNPYYNFIYGIALFYITMYLVPMTIVTALNTRLLVTFRRSARHRATDLRINCSSSSANVSYKRTVTTISMVIILISVTTDSFAMTSNALSSVDQVFPGNERLNIVRRSVANFWNVLVTVRCAVNFVIYCAFSRQFRLVLARTFLCRGRRRRRGVTSSKKSRPGSGNTGSSVSSKISDSTGSAGSFGRRVLTRISDRFRTMRRQTQQTPAVGERSLNRATGTAKDSSSYVKPFTRNALD